MPGKGIDNKLKHEDILTLEETYEIIKDFVELGIDKIRFTGGEPLVRKGIVDLIKKVDKLEGVREITMTTNGILLKKMGQALKEAGLEDRKSTRLNSSHVSISYAVFCLKKKKKKKTDRMIQVEI